MSVALSNLGLKSALLKNESKILQVLINKSPKYKVECAPQSRQLVKVCLREGNHGKNIKKKIYT